jgi:PAT family beta-lactamase induction signal transducer AmpG
MTSATTEVPRGANDAAPAPPAGHRVHPLSWITTLYAAESIPFAAVLMVSVFMYRDLRSEFPWLTDGKITLYTAWLALPWSLKPFWSPFLELYRTKKHIVVLTQILGGALFGCIALTLQAPAVVQMTLAAFFILAFNSATHDIAADGVYLDSLSTGEQAKYVGFQSAFWTMGQMLSQGGLVYVAGKIEERVGIRNGWMIVMAIFSVTLILLGLYHTRRLPRGNPAAVTAANRAEVFANFRKITQAFFLKRHIWWMIVFILLYRFSEAQISKVAPLFLRADRNVGGLGLTTADAGFVYGLIATGAFVLGSIAGGAFASKRGLKRGLLLLCVIFNVPNTLFTILAFTQPSNLAVITVSATVEKFTLGFGQVALILFMMQQVAPGKFKMAHYGFATALMNVGVMIPGMISGTVSDLIGYRWFFVYVLLAAIPSFLVAALVPFREIREDDPEEDPDRASRRPTMFAPAMLGAVILAAALLGTWWQLRSAPPDAPPPAEASATTAQ